MALASSSCLVQRGHGRSSSGGSGGRRAAAAAVTTVALQEVPEYRDKLIRDEIDPEECGEERHDHCSATQRTLSKNTMSHCGFFQSCADMVRTDSYM